MRLHLLVLAACVAIVVAGRPTVDSTTATFPQNGGRIAVTGSGFVRSDPAGQFNWILRNGAGVWMSNPGLRGFAGGVNSWQGCIPRTLEVNAGGNVVDCVMEYIPDYVIEASGAGTTTIEVDVLNGNGGVVGGDSSGASGIVIAVVENVVETIFGSNVHEVPQLIHGLTVEGRGFPAFDSIVYDPSSGLSKFQLRIDVGNGAVQTIDVAGSVPNYQTRYPNHALWDLGTAAGVQSNVVVTAGTQLITTTTSSANAAVAPLGDFACECTHSRDRVDCGFCTAQAGVGGIDLSAIPMTPNQGLQVSLLISSIEDPTGSSPVETTNALTVDAIGPTQIARVQNTPVPLVINPDSIPVIDWNTGEITIRAQGWAEFPSIQSNILVFVDDGQVDTVATSNPGPSASGAPWRCVPIRVENFRLTCRPTATPPEGTGVVPLTVVGVAGNQVSIDTDINIGFVAHRIADIDLGDSDAVADGIDPVAEPLQQDARRLTLRSSDSMFAVNGRQDFLSTPLDLNNANGPNGVVTRVTLTGIESGSTQCVSEHPNNPEIFTNNGARNPGCVIESITRSRITLRLPPVTQPLGTSVTADITTDFLDADGSVVFSVDQGRGTAAVPQVVGVVSPGAGVGGDPHFFGFLGEKYDFKGRAGEIYNILTDEDVQLNAVIGKWHYNRGPETIIRKLALRTQSHNVSIDAGGNSIGSAGFSISVDGRALPEGDAGMPLGKDGTISWKALKPSDAYTLPLWERHHGVAVIEIVLHNYRFEVLAVEEGRNSRGEWHHHPERFLDFMCQMFDQERHPHGLFGQTAHLPAGKRSASEFELEGEADDYKVTHEFATDFTFNQFQF